MKKIIAYIHTHWDREWYREFEEFRLRLIEVFDEIIAMLKAGEIPYFYFDGQTAALEDYLEIHPEKTEIIKNLIEEKKLRIGAFYCSSDSFLVSGECLYKNFEIGIKKSKELGETDFIGYLSDTFGHSKCVPYILKAHGIDKVCLWRGLGANIKADFYWDDIKATNLVQGYFQDFLNAENINIKKKSEFLKKYIDKIAQKSDNYILLPIGADHLAIAKNLKQQISELNKIYKDYEIKISTPFEYFEKSKPKQKYSGEFLDNELTFILSGVYSSLIKTKQKNAKAQWLLTNIAEPLQALSTYYFRTKNKQPEIEYAYKTLIKNQAHDSIYSCNIDEVQNEILQRFQKTNAVSNGIIKRTIRDLSTQNGDLSIINLSNNEYCGKIKITTEKKLPKWMNAVKISSRKGFTDKKLYNINEIPITEDITNINEYIIDVKNLKPFSITKIIKDNINEKQTIKTSNTSIENEFIKFEVKNNKIIVTDKKRNEKYTDFITITDRADIGDSYNFGPLKNDEAIIAKLSSFKLKENNNQRAILSLKYRIRIPKLSTKKGRTKKEITHYLTFDAILYNSEKHIEFEAKWENKSKNHILQVGFNLKEKITKTISEDLYGTVERTFNPDFDIYKQIPASKGKEIKTNTAPMQRFVQTQNMLLITKGNCEYEINKNTLKLTILRATGIISNPQNPARGTPAGPPLVAEKLQCLEYNWANFAIAFSQEEKDFYKLADNYYTPVIPLFTDIKDTQFINFNNKNIRVTSIQTKSNGINLRIFNNSEKKQTIELNLKESQIVKIFPKEIKNIAFPPL